MFKASIIIPSHRENLIISTCENLLKVKEIEKCEIIVVTDYKVSKYEKTFPQIKWYNINQLSIPSKRNFGIQKSSSEILGFLDDDCLPENSWLLEALSFLEKNLDCVGVEGQTSIESSKSKSAHLSRFKRLEKAGYRTNNIFYRKSSLEEIGLFDERFKFQREDSDLAYSLLSKNYKIGFSTKIVVTHLFRQKEKWDLLKNYFNRRYDPLLHKKHPILYRRHIKTPITRSAFILLNLYIATILSSFISPTLLPISLLICFIFILVGFLLSGNSVKGSNLIIIATEFISYLIGPFVLWGALIYGSLRFKHILLF